MNIPQAVWDAVPDKTATNDDIKHAEMAFDQLSEIYRGNLFYVPDNMGMLANTLERYYKGLIKAMEDAGVVFSFSHDELMRGHDLNRLADRVEEFKPLFGHETRYDRTQRRNALGKLRHLYSASRYDEYPDFDEFRDMYRIVSAQRDTVMNYVKELSIEKENEGKGMD